MPDKSFLDGEDTIDQKQVDVERQAEADSEAAKEEIKVKAAAVLEYMIRTNGVLFVDSASASVRGEFVFGVSLDVASEIVNSGLVINVFSKEASVYLVNHEAIEAARDKVSETLS